MAEKHEYKRYDFTHIVHFFWSVKGHIQIGNFEHPFHLILEYQRKNTDSIILKPTYVRFCSLQSGCCRDLHKASIPLLPIMFCVRSTFLNSDWPEHKAADKASMDGAVNLLP